MAQKCLHFCQDLESRQEDYSQKGYQLNSETKQINQFLEKQCKLLRDQVNEDENYLNILSEDLQDLTNRLDRQVVQTNQEYQPDWHKLANQISFTLNEREEINDQLAKQHRLLEAIREQKRQVKAENERLLVSQTEIRDFYEKIREKPFRKQQILQFFEENCCKLEESIAELRLKKTEELQRNAVVQGKVSKAQDYLNKEEQAKQKIQFKIELLQQETQTLDFQFKKKQLALEATVEQRKSLVLENKSVLSQCKSKKELLF